MTNLSDITNIVHFMELLTKERVLVCTSQTQSGPCEMVNYPRKVNLNLWGSKSEVGRGWICLKCKSTLCLRYWVDCGSERQWTEANVCTNRNWLDNLRRRRRGMLKSEKLSWKCGAMVMVELQYQRRMQIRWGSEVKGPAKIFSCSAHWSLSLSSSCSSWEE